jgi:hypothetical protein
VRRQDVLQRGAHAVRGLGPPALLLAELIEAAARTGQPGRAADALA